MMQRLVFQISTDTGSQGDTGVPMHGEIVQMRWSPDVVDTGADLTMSLLPAAGDSGDGFAFYADNDCLGVGFTRIPVQPRHHADGADTGAADEGLVAFAGDRLRVKVIPGGAAVRGRLYVWIKE